MRYFSRTSIYTFQRALVDLFVDGLVPGFPFLIFLPCFVVEAGTSDDGWRGVEARVMNCFF